MTRMKKNVGVLVVRSRIGVLVVSRRRVGSAGGEEEEVGNLGDLVPPSKRNFKMQVVEVVQKTLFLKIIQYFYQSFPH